MDHPSSQKRKKLKVDDIQCFAAISICPNPTSGWSAPAKVSGKPILCRGTHPHRRIATVWGLWNDWNLQAFKNGLPANDHAISSSSRNLFIDAVAQTNNLDRRCSSTTVTCTVVSSSEWLWGCHLHPNLTETWSTTRGWLPTPGSASSRLTPLHPEKPPPTHQQNPPGAAKAARKQRPTSALKDQMAFGCSSAPNRTSTTRTGLRRFVANRSRDRGGIGEGGLKILGRDQSKGQRNKGATRSPAQPTRSLALKPW